MESRDHDKLTSIDAKVDLILKWMDKHDTAHLRGRLLVYGALLSAVLALVLAI